MNCMVKKTMFTYFLNHIIARICLFVFHLRIFHTTSLIGPGLRSQRWRTMRPSQRLVFGWVLKWKFGSIHFQGKIRVIFRDECCGTISVTTRVGLPWPWQNASGVAESFGARPCVPKIRGFGAGCSVSSSIGLSINYVDFDENWMILEYLNSWILELPHKH